MGKARLPVEERVRSEKFTESKSCSSEWMPWLDHGMTLSSATGRSPSPRGAKGLPLAVEEALQPVQADLGLPRHDVASWYKWFVTPWRVGATSYLIGSDHGAHSGKDNERKSDSSEWML